jgi:hypothetical protein
MVPSDLSSRVEDLSSMKLSESEVARAKALKRRLGWIVLFAFLAAPISLIILIVLKGRISSFNSIVDAYLMPALHSTSPGLWRSINYGFTNSMRYSAEYLLIGWVTSLVLGIIAGLIIISVVRKMDLNYFILNAQERNRPLDGGVHEFLLLLGWLIFAALSLLFVHEIDFLSAYERKPRKWDGIYFLIPSSYPTIMLFLLGSAMQAKKIYILLKLRLRGST